MVALSRFRFLPPGLVPSCKLTEDSGDGVKTLERVEDRADASEKGVLICVDIAIMYRCVVS